MATEVTNIKSTMSWLLCLCILCASSIHSDDMRVITDNHQVMKESTETQEKTAKEKEPQPQVQGQETEEITEDVMDSDTGKPPGVLDTGQTSKEDEGSGQPDRMRERIHSEDTEGSVQTPPASLVSPEEEKEEDADSDAPVQEHSSEEEDKMKQEVEEERKRDVIENVMEETVESGGKEIGHHLDEVFDGDTDEGMVEHPGEETQIAPPSIADEDHPLDPGQIQIGDAEMEVGDEEPRGEGNVTSEMKGESARESLEAEKSGDGDVSQEGEQEKKEDEDKEETEKEEETVISESIPPFDEWKAKMLQQAQEEQDRLYGNENKEMPPAVPRPFIIKDGKNYASADCSAKILSANKEAQSASHILNFNRDEYMINPCSADIWFIVELCEPIQIKLLEIANLELFSSVPESFRVYTSDRFPAREWRLLGTLFAREERNLQSFLIDEHLFTKFLKIELLTFFGKEHYCPLTVLRVYGTSMVEEIDAEEEGGGAAVLPPEPTPLAADLKENGLLGHAKNMVMSIVNNAAKAFTGEDKSKDSLDCQGEGCEHIIPEEVNPTPAMDCWQGDLTTSIPDVEDSLQEVSICPSPCDDLDSDDFKRVCVGAVCVQSDYWNLLPNCCLMVLAHTTIHICCGISNCYLMDPSREQDVVEEKNKEPSSEKEETPPDIIGTPLETVATASPVIISNLNKDKPQVLSAPVILPSTAQTTPSVTSVPPLNTKPPTAHVTTSLPVPSVRTPLADEEDDKEVDKIEKTISPTPSVKQDLLVSSSASSIPSSDSSASTTVPSTSSDSAYETPPPSSESVEKITRTSATDSGATLETKLPPSGVASTKDIEPTPLAKGEDPKPTDDVKKTDENSEGELGKVEKTVSKDEVSYEVVTDEEKTVPATPQLEGEAKVEESGPKSETEPTKATEQSQSNGSIGHSGVSSYGSQTDSVFMRLNNRIKSLELNLSLSSKYLEQLSKSYKKQMEEMQKSFNKTVKTLTEKVQKSQDKNQKNSEDITRLDSHLHHLDTVVSSLSHKTEGMLQEVVERHLFLMICEVLIFCTLFMICVRRERNQLRLARDLYDQQLEVPQRRNTLGGTDPSIRSPRSRSSSADRDGLRVGGSVDDLLIIGPTTPLREAMKANSSSQTRLKPKQKDLGESKSNGSLANPTEFQSQTGKGPKKKGESKATNKMSHYAGVLFQGSAGNSRTEPSQLSGHSPETIGTVNGTAVVKAKKIQNGSKVKR